MGNTLRIDLTDQRSGGRFSRLELIPWWDQKRLLAAKVLVVGAGALGNEIVKNLALLGVGNVFIADLDTIEDSNLSRSVLFREADNGQKKAEVAARSARGIFPEMNIQWFHGNIVHDLGLGVYRWADITLAGLDNREARLAINRSCYRVGRPWIDGAIEQIDGVARMFVPPEGACYECTMSELDWKLLEMRRSCNLLTREEMQAGKVPTTPTIASVIAGVEVQEAVKYLHGCPTLAGRGYVFNGTTSDSYLVEYVRKEECYSHETYEPITQLDSGVGGMTLGELLSRGKSELGSDAVVEFNSDVLHKLECRKCGTEETLFLSLGKVTERMGRCPRCKEMRNVVALHGISGGEDFLDRTFGDVGVPPFDILTARSGTNQVFFEFTGDAPAVLGELARGPEVP